MFLSVKHIERSGVRVDRQVRPQAVTSADGRVIPFEPVALAATLTPRRGGYRFQGHLSAFGTFDCARCLEPFRLEIQGDFDLFYSASAPELVEGDGPDTDLDPLAFTPLVDERIDLSELVSEQLYLNLPLKPLCAPDCRGLCVGCGANRNLDACRCEEAPVHAEP